MTDEQHATQPEDPYAELSEAERLGLLVGSAYGAALAERDEAQARVAALEDQVNTLVHAARRVLDLGVLENLTWAKDEDDVAALRQAVESIQAPETTKD